MPRAINAARAVASTALLGRRLGGRLGASSVVLVRKLAVYVDHMCTTRDVKLIFCSACSTPNCSYASTFGHCHFDSFLTAVGASECRRQFLLDNSDDTPTSATHGTSLQAWESAPLFQRSMCYSATVMSAGNDECRGYETVSPGKG